MQIVTIDTARISDWPSFHAVFAERFGFPSYYGQNLDAWIDCMSSLDRPEDGMTSLRLTPGELVTLELLDADDFRCRCTEQFTSLLDIVAFVNWRRTRQGDSPILALAYNSMANSSSDSPDEPFLLA